MKILGNGRIIGKEIEIITIYTFCILHECSVKLRMYSVII